MLTIMRRDPDECLFFYFNVSASTTFTLPYVGATPYHSNRLVDFSNLEKILSMSWLATGLKKLGLRQLSVSKGLLRETRVDNLDVYFALASVDTRHLNTCYITPRISGLR